LKRIEPPRRQDRQERGEESEDRKSKKQAIAENKQIPI
jgi:hypothetical protein